MNFARGILVALDWLEISNQRDRPLVPGGTFHFYNPACLIEPGWCSKQSIMWNAFPKELLPLLGHDRAMIFFGGLFSGSTKLIPE